LGRRKIPKSNRCRSNDYDQSKDVQTAAQLWRGRKRLSDVNSILALARAGAVSRAWAGFVDAGFDQVTDDPKVLTLKGRLLKDQARATQGEAQARLFLRSAQAYADASALSPDSYPLINSASMSLFAGQTSHMEMLARQVLSLLETGVGGGETPYWHEATKAEAQFLLGHENDARATLSKAIAHAPNAWEDHAATLRQFRQILRFRGQSDTWLAEYAPPKSLYFKGLIGLASDDIFAAGAITEWVNNSGAAFGYGALAAGADILVAEALMQSGGELHVVLPVIPSAFRVQSVAPYGAEWAVRFDLLFENAASVEIVGGSDILSEAAIKIATQVAKGRAIERAGRLESEAVGVEVVDVAPKIQPAGHENILVLPRSADFRAKRALPVHKAAALVATDAAACAETWDIADGLYFTRYDDVIVAHHAAAAIRRDDADARIAISLSVNTGDNANQQRHDSRVIRMLQAAAMGTTIASADAAMALKSENPGLWTEALGELPDASGAIELYAIGANC
jgi:hypothetical protein